MDQAFNTVYQSSPEKEDDLSATVDFFRENQDFLKLILGLYLQEQLKFYILVQGNHCETKSTVALAELLPDLFAKCFRFAIGDLKHDAETGQNGLGQHDGEKAIKWLEQNHPHQLKEHLIENQELDNEMNSPAMQEREKKFFEKLKKMLKQCPKETE